MSNLKVANRCLVFWQEFNSRPNWRYPQLPPTQLQRSLDLRWAHRNRGELIRAEWMWTRRPKSVLAETSFGYPLLVFVALLLLLIPHVGILFTITWCAAMFTAIARATVRLVRWRREYEVSITRVVRSNRNFK
jgi:hypothetical protein